LCVAQFGTISTIWGASCSKSEDLKPENQWNEIFRNDSKQINLTQTIIMETTKEQLVKEAAQHKAETLDKKVDVLKAEATEKIDDVKIGAVNLAENASEKAEDLKEQATDTWEEIKDKASETYEDVKDKAEEIGDKIADKYEELKEKAKAALS
jgi:hypothetical protein